MILIGGILYVSLGIWYFACIFLYFGGNQGNKCSGELWWELLPGSDSGGQQVWPDIARGSQNTEWICLDLFCKYKYKYKKVVRHGARKQRYCGESARICLNIRQKHL